jgi:hypothetical protein
VKPLPALPKPAVLILATLMGPLASPLPARAQSSCSSDGQRAPVALMERFISADCATCWNAVDTPLAPRGAVALDWIVPGTQGDDAPLSAAATRDATGRLQALGRNAPLTSNNLTTHAGPTGALRLRVAQGPAVNGYVGASIELRAAAPRKGPVSAWLALVETIPAGIEGSPVERNLVRNVVNPSWNGPGQLSKSEPQRFIDSRAMSIPEGANPERLRVIGWVEDMRGHITVIAQSRCAPADQR